jgi:hypothetical protein
LRQNPLSRNLAQGPGSTRDSNVAWAKIHGAGTTFLHCGYKSRTSL